MIKISELLHELATSNTIINSTTLTQSSDLHFPLPEFPEDEDHDTPEELAEYLQWYEKLV